MEKNQEMIELKPFSHNYYWKSFIIDRESLMSPDKRYLLRNVLKDGSVELVYLPCSEDPELVIVKAKWDQHESEEKPPTIFVVESDFEKQSATVRELRMR